MSEPLPATPAEISLFSENGSYVFRNDDAFALYWHRLDGPAQSKCVDECASLWPALVPTANAKAIGEWTIFTRADSVRQWAYRGKPVYTYSKDTPGRAVGDGAQGVWHLLRI